jgi:lipoic acid synthetase
MIMGNICTRNCGFCSVNPGIPAPLDEGEPERIAKAVGELRLKHCVITSVTRDDLADGGAFHFASCIRAIREKAAETIIEVLIPDFMGSIKAISDVCDASPDILNHNLETVPRLYEQVRPKADYERSLSLLSFVKKAYSHIITKSGLMLGLGEKEEEVIGVLKNLKHAGCDMVTIGQYLSPKASSLPVIEFIHPDKFAYYKKIGEELGFKAIASAPFVRSSYMAEENFKFSSQSRLAPEI